ncbi:hypothetical protein [Streptomyces sp. NPDC048106]|uniref:hypothetical protein n=1 Tax=Streptomyces sp. NPDC048106 TaxID=3155750 RepID=UPI003451C9FA
MSPPPPPASARFPDAPPRAAHGDGAGAESPRQRPRGTGAEDPGGPIPPGLPPRRAAAPAETAAETTTRLRPVPPVAEDPHRPGSGPAEDPSETTTRLRPVPPAAEDPHRPGSGPGGAVPAEDDSETTTRLRPVPAAPPAVNPPGPGPGPVSGALRNRLSDAGRPHVSFGEPEVFRERGRGRTAVAGVCLVLGLGLVGGAVAGSWLAGDHGDGGARGFAAAVPAWHSVPVDTLFPPVVRGAGAGPGGADRTWTRVAVAPDSGCADAFDPLLRKVLAGVGCRRLLRATYTDATQSYVTTVGLLFTKADPAAMSALATRFRTQHLAERADLMPRPYAAGNTPAAGFGDDQRATWTISVRTDAPVVVYAVSGWADGRSVDTPQPAADAVRSGATTPQAQSGLGTEARGLAGRIERRLLGTIGSTATKRPS